MNCGEAVMQLLADYEVDTVFGMAGTMTVELYRGIGRAGIRHEAGALLIAALHVPYSGAADAAIQLHGHGAGHAEHRVHLVVGE